MAAVDELKSSKVFSKCSATVAHLIDLSISQVHISKRPKQAIQSRKRRIFGLFFDVHSWLVKEATATTEMNSSTRPEKKEKVAITLKRAD